MCPNQEWNQQPFALWNDIQPSHTSQGAESRILTTSLYYLICPYNIFYSLLPSGQEVTCQMLSNSSRNFYGILTLPPGGENEAVSNFLAKVALH